MKTRILFLCMVVTIWYQAFPQQVGINTNNPQEALHVHGKVQIDTLDDNTNSTYVVTVNNDGVLARMPIDSLKGLASTVDSGEVVMPLIYGETISAGNIVSIGDGKTGYMTVFPVSLPPNSFSEQTTRTRLISQRFQTSSRVVGIRALVTDFTLPGSAIMIYKAFIRNDNGGVPGSITIGSISQLIQVGSGSGSSGGIGLLVFDPPITVAPNTYYHLVMTAYDSISGSNSLSILNSDAIPNSYMSITTNSGSTWTTYPSKDCFVRIYETQTIASRVYRSQNFDPNTVISPNVVSTFNYNPFSNFTDKGNACIGVAKESGVAGEVKRVSLGPIATIPGANLSIGTIYTVSGVAGQLGSGGTRVGMGIGPTKLLITH